MESQLDEPGSPLEVVRAAMAARKDLRDAAWPTWLASPDDVLAFRRDNITCVLNTGTDPLPLEAWGSELLASSRALDEHGRLPSPGTAWLR